METITTTTKSGTEVALKPAVYCGKPVVYAAFAVRGRSRNLCCNTYRDGAIRHGNTEIQVPEEDWQAAWSQAVEAAGPEPSSVNIGGLSELRDCMSAWNRYEDARHDLIATGGVGRMPEAPTETVAQVSERYPVAAAYLHAESYSLAHNDRKASAGRRAMERIAAGEDHDQVIEEMEREWSDAARAAIWD